MQPGCDFVRLKTRRGDDRSSRIEGCEEAANQSVDMEEWHQVEAAVSRSKVQGSGNGSSIPADTILPERHPFGLSGRP